MATKVIGLSEKQHTLLKRAFGYESYPNGESGHTREAVEWLEENMGDKFSWSSHGCAHLSASAKVTKPYFTYKMLRELRELSR